VLADSGDLDPTMAVLPQVLAGLPEATIYHVSSSEPAI
jgi:hypothetical protein